MKKILLISMMLVSLFIFTACSDAKFNDASTMTDDNTDKEDTTITVVEETTTTDKDSGIEETTTTTTTTTTSTTTTVIPATPKISDSDFDTSKSITIAGCYDTDGGVNEDLKGYVLDESNKTFYDVCKNGVTLTEYSCGVAGYKKETSVSCSLCEDGKCVDTSSIKFCSDTDFQDEFTKGTVSFKGDESVDYCNDDLVLVEYFCNSVDTKVTKTVVCKEGCSEGKCNLEIEGKDTSTCQDPDLGTGEEFIKTTVTDPKGSFTDECIGTTSLMEYACNTIGYKKELLLTCKNGCEDGACLE